MPSVPRAFVWLAAGAILSLGAGCGPGNSAPIPGAATGPEAGFDGNGSDADGFAAEGPAWDVPIPPAKPPVSFRDYEPLDDAAPSPGQAALGEADDLKAAGRYDDARQMYDAALAADPTLARAAYQLACNEALAGNLGPAREAFRRAMTLGYADYPIARTDGELGALRTDADFPDRLRTIRRRYLERAAENVGTPFYITPADLTGGDPAEESPDSAGAAVGAKPPVMLLLHGYGDTHESYAPEALAWAELGWAAVAVPGSIPTGGAGGFVWPTDGENAYDAVDRQLRALLNDPGLNAVADTSRVFLLGFSQGANQAVMQTVRDPARYAGAVGLSPGGLPRAMYREPRLDPSAPRPIAMFYGTEEDRRDMLTMWGDACRSAGWPGLFGEFPGAHHFPRDWQGDENEPGRRARVAAFLSGGGG